MGTRGAFGVIIGEKEKIGYNQYDSYPGGKGVQNLRWLRGVVQEEYIDSVKALADACVVVSDEKVPTAKDVRRLKPFTDLSVSEQSTKDWYCLTRGTHGDIAQMLRCGYILDSAEFPLDSLFCEWAYILDLDLEVFEVYAGFRKELPAKGRWAGRPTADEDLENFKEHLVSCHRKDLDPWKPEVSEYKAVELIRSYPLSDLPTDEEFIQIDREEEAA